jgi:cell division protein FtsZ
VQEACSIIQGAAHEDANIIFGAVLDEKMKDSVKITVIATGFRARSIREAAHVPRNRQSAPREDRPYDARHSEPERPGDTAGLDHVGEGARLLPSEPEQQRQPVRETNLNRSVNAEFAEDDLDVPAFLRKKKTE